ncbi:Uncharacterised protein [Streptococcus pneumoniae]|nr:Uncharacterised protein [Streptococcus pneumoniae]
MIHAYNFEAPHPNRNVPPDYMYAIYSNHLFLLYITYLKLKYENLHYLQIAVNQVRITPLPILHVYHFLQSRLQNQNYEPFHEYKPTFHKHLIIYLTQSALNFHSHTLLHYYYTHTISQQVRRIL